MNSEYYKDFWGFRVNKAARRREKHLALQLHQRGFITRQARNSGKISVKRKYGTHRNITYKK